MIRIATRRSPLALAQSQTVADAITRISGHETRLVEVVTQGDVDTRPLQAFGGVGVFVSGVRQAVLAGEADVAVHSMKDVPTAPGPLPLDAVLTREDPRDALCTDGRRLADLPPGSRIGTGSPRRASQLRALRPDLEIVGVRGNVGTRLNHVRSGELDGVVLAMAGLRRLGLEHEAAEPLSTDVMCPAPGQGALLVEAGLDRLDASAAEALHHALRAIEDPGTRASTAAERSFLATLEAGCSAPIGAYGQIRQQAGAGQEVQLEAVATQANGSLLRLSITGPAGEAQALGEKLAADALDLDEGGLTR